MSIFNTGKSLLNKSKVIPIFYAISDDYSPYVACSIASIIAHANPKKYYRIVILHDGLKFHNYVRLRNLVTKNCEIQFHRISHSIYLRMIIAHCARKTGAGDFYSSAIYYYRSFIARLYPAYNKAIYIDSDTIVLSDIAELFETDLKDNAVGAIVDKKVADIKPFRDYVEKALGVPHKEYVNSGVLLMDLKKLRKMHYLTHMINLINQYDANLVAPDQDYLNVICRGQIYHLDAGWNAAPVKGLQPESSKLLHYNLFKKPWQSDGVDGEEVFWEAARKSGYFNELQKKKQNYTVKETRIKEAQVEALIAKAAELAKVKHPLIKI